MSTKPTIVILVENWDECRTSNHTGRDLQCSDHRIVMTCLHRNGEEVVHIVNLVWWIPRTLNPTEGEQYEAHRPNISSKQTEYNNRKRVRNVDEVHDNITQWQTSIYVHTMKRGRLVSRSEQRGTKVVTHILWDEDKTRAVSWCEGWGKKVGTHSLRDKDEREAVSSCER